MKDEFLLLRLIILLSAGTLVLGVVVRVCHEAAAQRSRMENSLRRSPTEAAPGACSGSKGRLNGISDFGECRPDTEVDTSPPFN
jgi:hypothetical protein